MPARDEYFYRKPQRGSYEFSAREERIYGPPNPPRGGETDHGEDKKEEKKTDEEPGLPPDSFEQS